VIVKVRRTLLTLYLLCAVLLTGCFSRATSGVVTGTPPSGTATLVATQPGLPPVQNTPIAIPPTAISIAPTLAVEPIRLWMSPSVPVELQAALAPLINSGRYAWANEQQSQVRLTRLPPGASSPLTARWIYVPVVGFGVVTDSVMVSSIEQYWQGNIAALAPLSQNGQPPILITTAPILLWLTEILGLPSKSVTIETVAPEAVSPTLYARGAAWGLLPFQKLDKSLKTLKVDGLDLFDRALPVEQYRLNEVFGLIGDPALVNETAAAILSTGLWMSTNRDPAKLSVVIMTGVTALTRATAYQMEVNGITLPVRDIAPFPGERRRDPYQQRSRVRSGLSLS
jgi:poly-gamma-glutamate synthesis protein (capsule biosynthesis protein)